MTNQVDYSLYQRDNQDGQVSNTTVLEWILLIVQTSKPIMPGYFWISCYIELMIHTEAEAFFEN